MYSIEMSKKIVNFQNWTDTKQHFTEYQIIENVAQMTVLNKKANDNRNYSMQ